AEGSRSVGQPVWYTEPVGYRLACQLPIYRRCSFDGYWCLLHLRRGHCTGNRRHSRNRLHPRGCPVRFHLWRTTLSGPQRKEMIEYVIALAVGFAAGYFAPDVVEKVKAYFSK